MAVAFGLLAAGCAVGDQQVSNGAPSDGSAPAAEVTAGASPLADEEDAPDATSSAAGNVAATRSEPFEVDADDTRLAVTVLAVHDPATAAMPGLEVDGRWVAVDLHLTNVGDGPYVEVVGSFSELVGADGDSVLANPFGQVEECTPFAAGRARVGPGATRRGCVTFAVPAGTDPDAFEFTPDAGMSSSTARIDLAGFATGAVPVSDDLAQDWTGEVQASEGDTLELRTSLGTVVAATVTRLIDPAKASSQPQGRWVAVEWTLEYVSGEREYEAGMLSLPVLVDAAGRTYPPTGMTLSGPAQAAGCQPFEIVVQLDSPGQGVTGCQVFDVPEDVTLELFELESDGNLAPSTGRWSLAG